jgi:hypothetical protein
MPASALAVNAPRENPKMKICQARMLEFMNRLEQARDGAYLVARKVVCVRKGLLLKKEKRKSGRKGKNRKKRGRRRGR